MQEDVYLHGQDMLASATPQARDAAPHSSISDPDSNDSSLGVPSGSLGSDHRDDDVGGSAYSGDTTKPRIRRYNHGTKGGQKQPSQQPTQEEVFAQAQRAAKKSAAQRRLERRFWVADLLKLLVTHMQVWQGGRGALEGPGVGVPITRVDTAC